MKALEQELEISVSKIKHNVIHRLKFFVVDLFAFGKAHDGSTNQKWEAFAQFHGISF